MLKHYSVTLGGMLNLWNRQRYNTGLIMNAFRLAIVGEGKGPHMFDITAVIGKEETLARLRRAIEVLK